MDHGEDRGSARARIVDDLRRLPLDRPGASAAAIYDRPVGLRLLHDDPPGEEHYLVRYPAGTRGRVHRHSSAHTIVVLEGRLDANGQVIGPGSYAHFPANQPMRHQSGGDEDCLFVVLFHGPFDVQIDENAGEVPATSPEATPPEATPPADAPDG